MTMTKLEKISDAQLTRKFLAGIDKILRAYIIKNMPVAWHPMCEKHLIRRFFRRETQKPTCLTNPGPPTRLSD